MKRLLFIVCLLLSIKTFMVADTHQQLNKVDKIDVSVGEKFLHRHTVYGVARQIIPPAEPIEERMGINWLWWIVGVVAVLAGGMLLYVFIKRNPRKDVC